MIKQRYGVLGKSSGRFFAIPVAVTDGDSIVVEPVEGGNRVKIRFGIDAPERKQPGGEASRGFVSDLALFMTVDVQERGIDRYKRILAVVSIPYGEVLQEALLTAGMAWVYRKYCRDCGDWLALEEEARDAGRGLWASPDPMPPWEWRSEQRQRRKSLNGQQILN